MTPLQIMTQAAVNKSLEQAGRTIMVSADWPPQGDMAKAAEVMRAGLLALANLETDLPDLPSRLYTDDALRDWLRIIAEDRLTESSAKNAPAPAAHEAQPSAKP